jgi:hypothetical protein
MRKGAQGRGALAHLFLTPLRSFAMFGRIATTLLLAAAFSGTASAGHHYYYSYPAYAPAYVYAAPVYVAPVHVAPVFVHHPVYVAPAPVYYHPSPACYAPVRHSFFGHGHRPYRGGVEIEVEWKRNGYEIEVEYDD